MNEKKCSFLMKIAYSFNPSAYFILSFQKFGAVLGFVLLFTLLTVGIQAINFSSSFINKMHELFDTSNMEEVMQQCIPEFKLEDGKLSINEVVDASYEGVVIYIDDSLSEVTMSDMDYLSKNTAFDVFVLGSSSNLILYGVNERKYQEIDFSDFRDLTITKADTIEYITSAFDVGIIVMVIIWYLAAVCAHFIIALFYFLIFLVLNLFIKRRVDAAQIYATCVFAIVPYHIVKLVLGLLPIEILGELINPLYMVSVLLIGGFALYSVHEENSRQAESRLNPFRHGGDYLYVSVNATTADSDDAFGGYASIDKREVGRGTGSKSGVVDKSINLKGVMVKKSDLEIADKYVQGNLKEMAVSNLQNLTGLSAEECLDIVYHWYQYYC